MPDSWGAAIAGWCGARSMVATRSGPRGRWCRSTRDSAGGGAVVRWVKEVAGVGGTYPRPSPGWRAVTGVAESNRSEYKNPGTLVDADSAGGDDLGPVLDRAALSGGHQLLSHTDAVHPGRDRVVGPDHHPRRVRPRAADPRCRAPGLRRRHPAGVVLRPRRRPRGVASPWSVTGRGKWFGCGSSGVRHRRG